MEQIWKKWKQQRKLDVYDNHNQHYYNNVKLKKKKKKKKNTNCSSWWVCVTNFIVQPQSKAVAENHKSKGAKNSNIAKKLRQY